MKVSIGSKIINGPWGGGNLFVINLKNYLEQNGHQVIFDLTDKDIDLILLTDPRSRKESSSTFSHKDIKIYKTYVNQNVKVVQRINECDERKNTKNINKFYLDASEVADKVVFVSEWLQKIYLNLGIDKNKSLVIMSGSDKKIFNKKNLIDFNEKEIKFVTHHWSSHPNKGFRIYKEFDNLISKPQYSNLKFTYIGNIPKNFEFKNTKIVKPLFGNELASEIKNHNIYLTASINEPSGNHHIEAALCGLPILFLKSGGIPEYCTNYGVGFDGSFEGSFEEGLIEIIKNYDSYIKKLENYPYESNKMCEEYLNLFLELTSNNKNLEVKSKFKRSIVLFKNKCQVILRKISFKEKLKLLIRK